MAVVNVELSEYDALRESLKDYKERSEKLDNELSGLKKGENVIVTTKYCVRKVENIEKLIESSIDTIKHYYSSPFYGYTGYSEILTNPKIIQCLTEAIYNAFAYGDSFCGIGDFEVKQSSTEVQGYNDLRLIIENKLKEEAKAEIESLKQSYINKKEEYEKKYSELKGKFEKRFKDQFEEFERTIENRKKTIIDLQTKLSEKSDRLEKAEKELSENVQYKNEYFDLKEQNELLNKKIETLTKELEKAKKPSLLNKIFNW